MSAILTSSTIVASSTSQSSRGTSIGFQQMMNILGVAIAALSVHKMPYFIGTLV
ncbi:MAG: hypothetical protein QXP55_05900 [Nitrososphaerales archaeon]